MAGFSVASRIRCLAAESEPDAAEELNVCAEAAAKMQAALIASQDMIEGAIPHASRIRDLLFCTLATVKAAIALGREPRAHG